MWRFVAILASAACSFRPGDAPGDGGVSPDGIVVERGVIARWDFEELGGAVAADTASKTSALHLAIDAPANVTWSGGALVIQGPVHLRSATPATRIVDACRSSGALTIEAWLTPSDAVQDGPARVLSISSDISHRNVTLAQSGDSWVFRLRTDRTNDNGIPELVTGPLIAATPALTHVVVTHDGTDRIIYVDGVERARDALGGSLAGWDASFAVNVANEAGGAIDRFWLGALHRIVVYERWLDAAEIERLHLRGL